MGSNSVHGIDEIVEVAFRRNRLPDFRRYWEAYKCHAYGKHARDSVATHRSKKDWDTRLTAFEKPIFSVKKARLKSLADLSLTTWTCSREFQ